MTPVTDPLILKSLQGAQEAELQPAPPDVAAALAEPQRPAYSGSFLPISRDAQGNIGFDSNTGIVGSLKRAFTLPGDVATGKVPIHTPEGQYNPELIQRSGELAALISPVNPAVRAGDRVIPGALKAGQRPIYPPSAPELKAAGEAGYDAARAAGLDISGNAVAEMARGLQSGLQADRGVIAKTAPKTFAILDELANPPRGGVVTIPGLEAARRGLSDVALEGGTEGFAARRAVRGIDDFMSALNDRALAPSSSGATAAEVAATLRDARGNYAAAQRSNTLTGELDRATTGILERAQGRAEATYSGRNLDNAIRQRVASLLERPADLSGFSDAEIAALEAVRKGTLPQNALRGLGNFLGGGGGLGQAVTAGMGAAGGGVLGGAPGAVLGAAAPAATGVLAKLLENALAKRSLSGVDEMVRMNSPLFREMLTAQSPIAPAFGREEAILRTLLPGLLAPPQQEPRPSGGLLNY